MLRGIRKQISLVDRSMLWLKELFIQLYYENGGCEPLASDALRVSVLDKSRLYMTEFHSINFNLLRHSVAQTIRSSPRPPPRPTRFTASRKIPLSKVPNLRPNNPRPRRVWKRKGRWWICLVTTIFLSCSRNNKLLPPTLANSNRFNRKPNSSRLKFNRNRFLRLFVIQTQLRQNVIAHLITYRLILI